MPDLVASLDLATGGVEADYQEKLDPLFLLGQMTGFADPYVLITPPAPIQNLITAIRDDLPTGERIAAGAMLMVSLSTEKLPCKLPKSGIYKFTGRTTKPYVGQSRNIPKRLERHLSTGKLPEDRLGTVEATAVRGGKTAREIAEQARIDALGGLQNTENLRNPIGPLRRHLTQ